MIYAKNVDVTEIESIEYVLNNPAGHGVIRSYTIYCV